jgi:NAD(P)-dependent dehydrogenase (short-subunit alcohol dehydrogenase family)
MRDFLGFTPGTPIVVTGAGSGIGKALATVAAGAGLRVAAWDVVGDTAAATADAVRKDGGESIAWTVDVGDESAVVDAWAATVDAFGPVSHLANIAGPPNWAKLEFAEGLATAVQCARLPTEVWLATAPREPGEAGEDRSAIFIASVAGTRYGMAGWYPVAKMGIVAYMRSLAASRPGGVRANAIAPDLTNTPRVAHLVESLGPLVASTNPMGRICEPIDVANAALFLLSPAASFVNGVVLDLDGGINLVSRAAQAAVQ